MGSTRTAPWIAKEMGTVLYVCILPSVMLIPRDHPLPRLPLQLLLVMGFFHSPDVLHPQWLLVGHGKVLASESSPWYFMIYIKPWGRCVVLKLGTAFLPLFYCCNSFFLPWVLGKRLH